MAETKAKTNFLAFNEEMNPDRTFSDSEYQVATQRASGVTPGMANSRLHNKMYHQTSAMAKAVADFLVSKGFNAMDNDIPGLTEAINSAVNIISGDGIAAHNSNEEAHADIRKGLLKAGLNILQRNKTYSVGDITYHSSLPSWARLECAIGGITLETMPEGLEIVTENQIIEDGEVTWIVRSVNIFDGDNLIKKDLLANAGGIVDGSLAQNGWVKFANGLILQWGIFQNVPLNQIWHTATFPIEFQDYCFCVNISIGLPAIISDNVAPLIMNTSISKTAFKCCGDHATINPGNGSIYWFAIGA